MTELMFKSPPDYEMPRGMPMSDTNTNTYMVTLKANDGTYMDTHDVTVNGHQHGGGWHRNPVADGPEWSNTRVDRQPSRTSMMVMVDSVMWQWSKSMTMDGTFMDIDEATMMTYTPMADGRGLLPEGHGDVHRRLRQRQ